MRVLLSIAVLLIIPLAAADPLLTTDGLVLEMEHGALTRLADPASDETILAWEDQSAGWYFTVRGDHTPVSPGLPVRVDTLSERSVRLHYRRKEAPSVTGTMTLSGEGNTLELTLTVKNRGRDEISVIGFPGGLVEAGGRDRYLVYPYQSGALVPLDERFDRIRIYDALPFILGYPSNVMSMQWMGVQRPGAGSMLMSTDRYGALKRMGARRSAEGIALVSESSASLPPGQSFQLPSMRIVVLGSGGYAAMASVYRDWVRERTSESGEVIRDESDGMEKVPLQFIPLEARRRVRPKLDRLARTHGFPEHAIRGKGDEAFSYMPYGAVVSMQAAFEETYGTKVTPQLWSFTQSGDDGGWPLLPIDPHAEAARTIDGHDFPAMDFGYFAKTVRARKDMVLLYTNPTFLGQASPDYDTSLLFDTSGAGDIRMGGLAAQASEDSAYVSPVRVQDYQVDQLTGVLRLGGGQGTGAIMYDSSQALGGTLFNNSLLRRDPLVDIDRNPAARYVDRYGYEGRDSYVQDRIKRDLALHAATPGESKTGEWVSELTSMYLDLNAGSICLKREYPDQVERDDPIIPVPLYQMVYGDTQYFTIRVGAASDADMGRDDPANGIPAEMSRRGTALFGGVHQVLYWGGVPWAGPACKVFHGQTSLITRDNLARRDLFGRQAGFRMLDANGSVTVSNYSVRETCWLDGTGEIMAWHYDNNTGHTATVENTVDVGPSLSTLWGEDGYMEGSLKRLKPGATATLMRNGNFALWNCAGDITWPGTDGTHRVALTDSHGSPRGLAVIWDGERLSLGNHTSESREIVVTASLSLSPDTEWDTVNNTTGEAMVSEQDGTWRFELTLPPAPPRQGLAVPASVVSLEAKE